MNKQRNHGVDLLKCICMLMVVVLHVLGIGGVKGATAPHTLNYEIICLLESFCYVSVNCYALASGYLGYGSKHKFSNIAYHWITVVFISLFITSVTALMTDIDVSILKAVTPVFSNQYWYFTAFFVLSFVSPIINAGIEHTDKSTAVTSGAVILLLSAVIPNHIVLAGGYGFLWLSILYYVGGVIKKYRFERKLSPAILVCIYALCSILSWFTKFTMESLGITDLFSYITPTVLYNYTSITVTCASIALFMLFSQAGVSGKTALAVSYLSPLTFGIYIYHTNTYIWNYVICNRFAVFGQKNTLVLVISVIAASLFIFIVFAVLEAIRHCFFKLIKLKELLNAAEETIRKKLSSKQK